MAVRGAAKSFMGSTGFIRAMCSTVCWSCVEAGVGGEGTRETCGGVGLWLLRPMRSSSRTETPRYTPASRYPIDGQCVAQALQTLSSAATYEPDVAVLRWTVLSFALSRFARGDGSFVYQRKRWWSSGSLTSAGCRHLCWPR